MENNSPRKTPSILLSLVPFLVIIVLLSAVIRTFGNDALSGGSQIALLIATAVCSLLSVFFCSVKWKEIESAITNNIFGVSVAFLILLLIGALSGSWMISGIVPTLIYYGMRIIDPTFFLASCCVICSVVSVMTGSSWTTIATIGVALIGIGEALGFSSGWTAGAIISGAYFGDKISPLSDTTVMASSISETPLFVHIRYMMLTTIPSMLLTLLIFVIAGLVKDSSEVVQAAEYSQRLESTFHISLWLLVVPVLTAVMIAKKVPTLVTLFVSAMLAGVFALLFQSHLLREISGIAQGGALSGFKGLFMVFYGNTSVDTGSEMLNSLVSTRGMAGMMNTIWLIICAMCFGGAMTASGMLESLTSVFLPFMRRRAGLVASTVLSGMLFNITTADQYVSIILTGKVFKGVYKKKGYESRLLSRTTEDAVTVTSVLVPWNSCGMTQASVLGVSTWVYMPYCFFNLISPLMSIIIAVIGYKIRNKYEEDKNIPIT